MAGRRPACAVRDGRSLEPTVRGGRGNGRQAPDLGGPRTAACGRPQGRRRPQAAPLNS